MATEIKTYDPSQIQITVGGTPITGYEPGTFINIVRDVNNFDFTVGPDGKEGIRTKLNNRSALVTLTLRQVSVSNLVLSNLANRDEVSGDGVVPVQVTDLSNPDTQFVAAKGWLEKPADAAYAESPQGRPWAIRMGEVAMKHGGNPPTAALQGTIS